jgi:hypothetical protein
LASVLGGSPELYDATVTQPARVMRWRIADLQELAGADESLTVGAQKDRGRRDRRQADPVPPSRVVAGASQGGAANAISKRPLQHWANNLPTPWSSALIRSFNICAIN